MSYSIDSRWKAVVRDDSVLTPEVAELWQQGLAAAPANYLGENTVAFLPKKPAQGLCRLCGKTARLTKEHVPPKQSGNKSRSTEYKLSAWLENQDLDDMGRGKIHQGGIYGYTLCSQCNSVTGRRYGSEYQKWAFGGYAALAGLPLDKMNGRNGPFALKVQFGKTDNPVHPGALVRQVLSMMCSLSGTWDLAGSYPVIKSIVLDEATVPLPSNLDLGMSLYAGPRARMVGPQLKVDLHEKTWQWLMEIAYPPFSFVLVLASSTEDPLNGLVLNEWSMQATKAPLAFKGEIGVGFGWSPYPADFRTRAQIEAEAA
jgi:hypothetical protein